MNVGYLKKGYVQRRKNKMDRLEIRKQIQDVADELYESIPNGPLKYISQLIS